MEKSVFGKGFFVWKIAKHKRASQSSRERVRSDPVERAERREVRSIQNLITVVARLSLTQQHHRAEHDDEEGVEVPAEAHADLAGMVL